MQEKSSSSGLEARRRFLAACGKFAVVTPPTITLMLAAAERSYVAAQSGGGGAGNGNGNGPQGNNGFGNGGGDGSPNGLEDVDR